MCIFSILGLYGMHTIFRITASLLIFSAIPIIPNNKLSNDPWLNSKYYQDPDACDLSDLTVVENVVSCRKDIVTLFWENKLGVDVEVRILPFK